MQAFVLDATEHSSCKLSDSRFAPANVTNGLSFEPQPFAAKQTDTLTFSYPVVSKGISFEPVLSTVIDETISFQTDVLFIAKIELPGN